ncbi:hypothetical protein Back11_55180 [Paenibacillus baekrokdamisoli]|uniref:Uncharacterized protein n=1 Tax=Paenibacillus baekrokdamisoli TaxID=1712516 RepID=A0A3G9JGR3_9BACL|nr:hypothetical protein [Paenibacillus baekrokdamisoli]BBH24173.1 hypothetical protein Back11_55180 [Paenibacillus baekrokdamisoli]
MFEFLTHYYKQGDLPFRSLSALTDSEALKIMESLYEDNPLAERFKEPVQYLNNRKQTEKWVRDEFIAKGGQPKDEYPLYAVLGYSNWIENHLSSFDIDRIHIPLSIFTELDISFTYPDSMVTYLLGMDKHAVYYQPEYHGKIFTLSEVNLLANMYGAPEEKWRTALLEGMGPYIEYIEAQIWNHKPLLAYLGTR